MVMLQKHRALSDPLVRYADFQRCIERAKVLEERLTELHDAVERAVELLNSESQYGRGGEDMEAALAELNKVL
jgi:hypothetical protein